MTPEGAGSPGQSRRSLLARAGKLLAGGLALAILAPAGVFLGYFARRARRDEEFFPVADLARLPESAPLKAEVIAPRRRDAWTALTHTSLGAVWLLRGSAGVTAFSTACPHAGCAVDWAPESRRFECPCHGSFFGPDGRQLDGPASRPLDQLVVRVDNDRVLVCYQRFRAGIAAKEPI